MDKVLFYQENVVCDHLLQIEKIEKVYQDRSSKLIKVYERASNCYRVEQNEVSPDIDKRSIMYTALIPLTMIEKKLMYAIEEVKYNKKIRCHSIVSERIEDLQIFIGGKQLNFKEKCFFLLLGRSIDKSNMALIFDDGSRMV